MIQCDTSGRTAQHPIRKRNEAADSLVLIQDRIRASDTEPSFMKSNLGDKVELTGPNGRDNGILVIA